MRAQESRTLTAIAEERLRGVPRYHPGRPASTPLGKLSSNESPYGPSPAARAAVRAVADELHLYPSVAIAEEVLAATLGVSRDEVLLTNGSDELCYLIGQVFLTGRPTRVVTSVPAYAVDEIVSRLAHSELVGVPLVDGRHDLDALAQASTDADVVWLPIPHNPTGTYVDRDDLERFLARIRPDCLVVLDEAYRGFVDQELAVDALAAVGRHSNVVLQRTFSKDHGLAGLRVGFGVGAAALIGALRTAQGPFAVNSAAIAVVQAACSSTGWRDMVVSLVRRERAVLEEVLDSIGVAYHRSATNFVTFAAPWAGLRPYLEEVGVSVRNGDDLGMPGWCRVTVGEPVQMVLVRRALRAWAEKGST